MKKVYNLFLMLILAIVSDLTLAQQLLTGSNQTIALPAKTVKNKTISNLHINGTANRNTTCGPDSIEFGLLKATGLRLLSINNATVTSANEAHQWYPAPQPILVSGMNFYGRLDNTLGIANQNITINIYQSGPDSMPNGAPLQSINFSLDTNSGAGFLADYKRRVQFNSPVLINNTLGYVISIQNNSTNSIQLISNEPSVGDGANDWCASIKFGSFNTRSYFINFNSGTGIFPFNADWLFEPVIQYELKADFQTTPTCYTPGTPINFINYSSIINVSKFYNLRAFFKSLDKSFFWNLGNGVSGFAIDTATTYNTSGPYTVTLTDTISGYYINCVDVKTANIESLPAIPTPGGGGAYCLGSAVNLTCNTVSGASYVWTGPNGFTSTDQNPVISSFSTLNAGQYDVYVVVGACSSAIASVNLNYIDPPIAMSDGPICYGQMLSLSTGTINGASYSWTGPNGFTSTSQNPIRLNFSKSDTGNYTLNVSFSGCNFSPSIVYVTGKDNPAKPIVGNAISICEGGNINLTATGAYSSPIYNWTGPNNFSSTQQNPSFSNATSSQAGTYSVYVNNNGCISASENVLVQVSAIPLTPLITNNGPLCVGQTLNLSTASVAGASYSWTGPNGFTSTSQNPSKTNVSSNDGGLYSLYISVNNCNSLTKTATININATAPVPTLSSNSPVCNGKSLTLSALNITGASYSWSGPNGFSSSIQNPTIDTVSKANEGIYSVTATTANCGTSAPATINISINTLPSIPTASNSGPICEGTSGSLNVNTMAGVTYAWSGPNGYSSSVQNPNLGSVSKLMAGEYTVNVSTASCGIMASSKTIIQVKTKPITGVSSTSVSLCEGDSFLLNANSTNAGPNISYSWSGPNNFTSSGAQLLIQNLKAIDAGSYQLSAIDSGCSAASLTCSLFVKPTPANPVITGPDAVCAGDRIDLSTPTISGATYTWTGPNSFSSSLRTPSILNSTVANSGSYVVHASVNGCKSAEEIKTIVVNVKPISPVLTNNNPVCEGDNVTISTPFVNKATYSWVGPNAFVSSSQNIELDSIQLNQAGQYTCVVSLANCVSDPTTTILQVNPAPKAPSISSFPINKICSGDSLQLYAGFVDQAVYTWNGPAGFSSNLRVPTIKNIHQGYTGTYQLSILKNGCNSAIVSIDMLVNPTPNTSSISGLTNVIKLDTTSYSVDGFSNSSYSWKLTGASVMSGVGTHQVQVKWLTKGSQNIQVTETSNQGCTGKTQTLNVEVDAPTGIATLTASNGLEVYPVPVKENLQINLSNQKTIQGVKIYSLKGELVLESNQADINSNQMAAGVYLVEVIDQNGAIYRKKIIKQ
jgi:hypothetical protein